MLGEGDVGDLSGQSIKQSISASARGGELLAILAAFFQDIFSISLRLGRIELILQARFLVGQPLDGGLLLRELLDVRARPGTDVALTASHLGHGWQLGLALGFSQGFIER